MELQKAIKIAEEIRMVAAAMDATDKAIALDILIQHAKQPVQVTDEMVGRVTQKMYDAFEAFEHDGYWEQLKEEARFILQNELEAALQAALKVKKGE